MKEKQGAITFFLVIALYILVPTILTELGISRLFASIAKLIIVAAALIYYKNWFSFKLKFDLLSLGVGVAIGLLWVASDSLHSPVQVGDVETFTITESIVRLLLGVLIAPLVEEFFTRFFLHRAIQAKDWLKVNIGKYELVPFLLTTAFFSFAHTRWVAGLVTGIILNFLWYYKKDMNSVVLAHAAANLVLGLIVVYFGWWHFW